MVGLSVTEGERRFQLLLVNHDGTVYGYEDRCAHQRVALSGGKLDGPILTCAAHAWTYDVRTGEGVNPEGVRLRRVPVTVEGDDILVEL
jgi:toluene monooxygenase system ferredoxin subunit